MIERPESDEQAELPAFTETLRTQIVDGIRSGVRAEIEVSAADWADLKRMLSDYVLDVGFLMGFLTAGQIDALVLVKDRSIKLLEALAEVDRVGAAWFIKQDGPDYTIALREFSAMVPSSPRAPDKHDPQSDFTREAPLTTSPSRGLLLERLDDWWLRVTGTKATVKEEIVSPFQHFLVLVFSVLPEDIAPGSSYSTVKQRRVEHSAPQKAWSRLGALLALRLKK